MDSVNHNPLPSNPQKPQPVPKKAKVPLGLFPAALIVFMGFFVAGWAVKSSQFSQLSQLAVPEVFVGEEVCTGEQPAPLYRLWRGGSSADHFYTMSASEKNNAVSSYGYTYEGIAGYLYASEAEGTAPLYRLWKGGSSADHFYTMSASEKDNAANNLGYTYEGIAGYLYASDPCAAASPSPSPTEPSVGDKRCSSDNRKVQEYQEKQSFTVPIDHLLDLIPSSYHSLATTWLNRYQNGEISKTELLNFADQYLGDAQMAIVRDRTSSWPEWISQFAWVDIQTCDSSQTCQNAQCVTLASPTPSPSPSPSPTPPPGPTSHEMDLDIDLEVKDDDSNDEVKIKVIREGEVKAEITVAVDAEGKKAGIGFSQLANAEHKVWTKPQAYLSQVLNLTFSEGTTISASYSTAFKAGDLNDDNEINSLDYSLFVNKYGSDDALADFNGDGEVNSLDYTIFLRNYGESGEE